MFLIRLHSTLCLSYGYSMQLRLYGRRAPEETDPIIPKQTIWYFIFSPYLKPACFPPLVFAEATPSTRNTLKSGVGKRVLKQRQHNQPYHHQHHHQNQQRLPPRRRRFDFSRLAESATSDLEGCQSPDSPASVSPPPTNYTRRQRDDLDHGLGLDFPHHQLSQHQAQMMMSEATMMRNFENLRQLQIMRYGGGANGAVDNGLLVGLPRPAVMCAENGTPRRGGTTSSANNASSTLNSGGTTDRVKARRPRR